ncbi:S9 family peptidase [Pseudovibrio sp. Ad37]|uniref:alpha/beta hydrolase family protein n=1 Tax=Pseudovibrio sp. Ad37 TaxID=989422 RepID=UPI0007AEACD2|nr:alpha/beta fold hydrolase [Pseudovibrio sp. Ad37]KZL17133.1 Alpha/beta hydrolase family protein [Pseudovibrio sp. Ad37]
MFYRLNKRDVVSGFITSLFVLVFLFFAQASLAQSPHQKGGPISEPLGELNMQIWRVPVELEDGSRTITLDATTFQPDGEGPFPLAVFTHGAARNAPRDGPYDFRPDAAIRWFLARGYAVAVVIRRGYGRSEGQRSVVEDGDSDGFIKVLEERVHDINSSVRYFQDQPFVVADHVVLLGFSAGGNSVLATSRKAPNGVRGVIAFAPGAVAIDDYSARDLEQAEQGFRMFGAGTTLPTLWVYAENEEYYSPMLARSFFEAYTSESDAKQELAILPLEGENGHDLFLRDEGPKIWGPVVAPFLERLMP